jgi:hypothetical protein
VSFFLPGACQGVIKYGRAGSAKAKDLTHVQIAALKYDWLLICGRVKKERPFRNLPRLFLAPEGERPRHFLNLFCPAICPGRIANPGLYVPAVPSKINSLLILNTVTRFNSVPGHHIFNRLR